MDLSYKEQHEKLSIRVRAHKEFANLDIADWMESFLADQGLNAPKILDLGCGNGNHVGLYLKFAGSEGEVHGLDRESSLVESAKEKYRDADNLFLAVRSMDDPLPFEEGTFDLCFSNFAIYNATVPRNTLLEVKRVMKSGAKFVMIGPTAKNAKEIYEFNERLTSTPIDEVTLIRTDRLRQEILPIANEIFGSSEQKLINSYLTFPSKEEFVKYYTATMLYEEDAEKKGVSLEAMYEACLSDENIILSKEMLAVVVTKA